MTTVSAPDTPNLPALPERMRHRRPHEGDVQESLELDVPGVLAASSDEPLILDAAHGLTDMRRHRN